MSRRIARVIEVVGVATLVVGLALGAGCGGDDSEQSYSSDTRASFLEPCVAGLGEEGRDICECSYDLIVEDIPFDEFEDIDRDLQNDPDAELPDAISDIVAACAADPSAADEPRRGGDHHDAACP